MSEPVDDRDTLCRIIEESDDPSTRACAYLALLDDLVGDMIAEGVIVEVPAQHKCPDREG